MSDEAVPRAVANRLPSWDQTNLEIRSVVNLVSCLGALLAHAARTRAHSAARAT